MSFFAKVTLGCILLADALAAISPAELAVTVYENPSTDHGSICTSAATSMTLTNNTCTAIPSGFNSIKFGALRNFPQTRGCYVFYYEASDCKGSNYGITSGKGVDPKDSQNGQCQDLITGGTSQQPPEVPKAAFLLCSSTSPQGFIDLLNSLQDDFYQLVADAKAWEEAVLNGQTTKREIVSRSAASSAFSAFMNDQNRLRNRFDTADGQFEYAYETFEIDEEVYRGYQNLRFAFNNGFRDIASWTATNLTASRLAVAAGFSAGGFLTTLLKLFILAGGNGGGISNPTTTRAPPPPVTTTTSTSCSPMQSPTEMVILTTESGTAAQYKEFINSLPKGSVIDQVVYDDVNYRACLATLDDCEAALAALNPIVEVMTLNSNLDSEEFSGSKKRSTIPEDNLEEIEGLNITFTAENLRKRLDSSVNLVLQQPSPPHLRWLSGLWHQIGLAGTYLGFQDFLYDDNSGASQSNIIPTVYILDTGADTFHPDISGQISRTYDSSVNDGAFRDINGHGTCMASLAGGRYSGVSKLVSMVPIKIRDSSQTFSRQWNIASTFGYIMNDVNDRSLQGRAVISISAGVNPAAIWYTISSMSAPVTVKHDYFEAMLSRVYARGLPFVTSAGNNAQEDGPAKSLNWLSPRKHGGMYTPMIVVGNANEDGTRYVTSNYLDPLNQGILTIYANGVNVQCAGASNQPPNIANYWAVPPPGTSQATAQVAGLVAYYLRKSSIRNAWIRDGGVGSVPLRAKQYLMSVAVSNKNTSSWPDKIPRAALGEAVNCTTTIISHVPTPAYTVASAATGLRLSTTSVTQGQSTVLPANQQPRCYQPQN